MTPTEILEARAVKEAKAAKRAAAKVERETREAKLALDIATQARAKFEEDTKNWNERLLFLSLPRWLGDHRSLYTDEYDMNVIPSTQDDLYTMESIESEVVRYKERNAEEQRKYQLRVNALAKLTEEERKALGV